MTSDSNSTKTPSTPKNWMGIGLLVLLCGLVLFAIWYLPPDPVSPPATALGSVAQFDALFQNADQDWRFLFTRADKVFETDIYGSYKKLVLDIKKATKNEDATLTYQLRISPDGKHLATTYYYKYPTNSGYLMLADIQTGESIHIAPVLEGYTFNALSPVYWLTPDIFLAGMHESDKNSFAEKTVYVRFDIHNLDQFKIIRLDNRVKYEIMKPDTNVLVLGSEYTPPKDITTWAIDRNGIREVNSEENTFFKKCLDKTWGEDCYQNLLTASIAAIEIKHVTNGRANINGRWYRDNLRKNFITLNDAIVRTADTMIEQKPTWEPDIEMFLWREGDKTYQMDSKGHYRLWFEGSYIDKIPKNQ